MATRIGYYTGKKGSLPGRTLGEDICAICDGKVHHITEENLKPGLFHILMYQLIKGDKKVELTCGHSFHENCIRGWTLVGKNQICPFCREKVAKFVATNPWETTQQQYLNMLDYFRILVSWNPLVFLVCHFAFEWFGLE